MSVVAKQAIEVGLQPTKPVVDQLTRTTSKGRHYRLLEKTLTKTPGTSLGVDLTPVSVLNTDCLSVKGIARGGLIDAFNELNPDSPLREGDIITRVNSAEGISQMIEELKTQNQLKLVVLPSGGLQPADATEAAPRKGACAGANEDIAKPEHNEDSCHQSQEQNFQSEVSTAVDSAWFNSALTTNSEASKNFWSSGTSSQQAPALPGAIIEAEEDAPACGAAELPGPSGEPPAEAQAAGAPSLGAGCKVDKAFSAREVPKMKPFVLPAGWRSPARGPRRLPKFFSEPARHRARKISWGEGEMDQPSSRTDCMKDLPPLAEIMDGVSADDMAETLPDLPTKDMPQLLAGMKKPPALSDVILAKCVRKAKLK